MSELSKRVAVAAVGIPIVLSLLFLGGWFVAAPLAGFAGWSAHEVYRLAAKRRIQPIEWIGVSSAVAFVLLAAAFPTFSAYAPFALGLVVVLALGSLLEAMRSRGPGGQPLGAAAVTLFGAVYTGATLAFAPLLLFLPSARAWAGDSGAGVAGLFIVALPLAATWIGDASAFFAGSAWGRNRAKLAPTISPNKSWVGFWASLAGGGAAGVLWLLAAGAVLPGVRGIGLPLMGLAGAVLGVVAVVGDLVESLLKREAGVKDSGTFFPGHGGVLDRVDSLLFTIPAAYVLLLLLVSVT